MRHRVARFPLDADAPVLHLTAVALEADRAGLRDLQLDVEHLAVAGRAGHAVLHGDHQLVPVLRLVVLQRLERAGEAVVAALQLRPAHEDAAVGIRRGAELELQHEVVAELARRPELLDLAAFGRRGHHEPAVDRDEAAIGHAVRPSNATGSVTNGHGGAFGSDACHCFALSLSSSVVGR